MNPINKSTNFEYLAGESPSETSLPLLVLRDTLAPMLSVSDLRNCTLLSRTWGAMAQPLIDDELKKRRMAMTFGPEDWKQRGYAIGSADSIPPLPADIDARFKRLSKYFPKEMKNDPDWKDQWAMLVLIPKEINGEPVTINGFGKLMRHQREGDHPTVYRYIDTATEDDIGKQPVGESQWVLVTNGVIPGSRIKNAQQQIDQIKEVNQECVWLHPLQAIVCNVVSLLKTGMYLFPEDPYTGTRCRYVMDGKIKYAYVVGSGPSGFYVHSSSDDAVYDFLGVAASLPCGSS